MYLFEKTLIWLQGQMNTPTTFGWFHCFWLVLSFLVSVCLSLIIKKHNDMQLKTILFIYGIVALALEILKQLIWSFNYDGITNTIVWDYQWYAFPFQLCTTPIYVSIICLFLKKGNIRDSLLSYMAYITILGSVATMIMPDSCFTSNILVNIHTMWLHVGSFVVSLYLLMSREVKINVVSFKKAVLIFIFFVFLAMCLNLIIYNMGILNGETFNMFYISPYFLSSLPVFDIIQQHVPYVIYLIIYIWALILGGFIVFIISLIVEKTLGKLFK